LSHKIPWDDLVKGHHDKMNSGHGRPANNGRLVIGAVIIKHKLNLSDEETVLQIQERKSVLAVCCKFFAVSGQAAFCSQSIC
jgi:hypothetical protein